MFIISLVEVISIIFSPASVGLSVCLSVTTQTNWKSTPLIWVKFPDSVGIMTLVDVCALSAFLVFDSIIGINEFSFDLLFPE